MILVLKNDHLKGVFQKMSHTIRSDGKFGWNILLILLLAGMTPGCTVMERLRMKPMEEPSVSSQAQLSLERRTTELAGIEEEAAGGAPTELARARTLLEEMDYFFQEGDYAQVNRLDSAMGESLDSIRGVLEAGGSPLS